MERALIYDIQSPDTRLVYLSDGIRLMLCRRYGIDVVAYPVQSAQLFRRNVMKLPRCPLELAKSSTPDEMGARERE